jgi:hypothetical protein
MAIKTMDPDKIRELIEGQPNIIAEAVDLETTLYATATCPNCFDKGADKLIDNPKIVAGPDGQPVVVNSPFSSGRPLARGYAKCRACGTEYDPESGVIRRAGYEPVMTDEPH